MENGGKSKWGIGYGGAGKEGSVIWNVGWRTKMK